MDINVEQGVMSEVFSEKGGFPYCTIEKRNDSVLMAKVNKNGTDVPDKNTAVRSKTLKPRAEGSSPSAPCQTGSQKWLI